jgi:hypothetical protein
MNVDKLNVTGDKSILTGDKLMVTVIKSELLEISWF